MYYALDQSVPDGVNKIFTISFPYLSKDHVEVRVGDTLKVKDVDYTWINDQTIQLNTAPAADAIVVERKRNTPKNAAIVTFNDGSTLTEGDMNLEALWSLYIIQEASDAVESIKTLNFGFVIPADESVTDQKLNKTSRIYSLLFDRVSVLEYGADPTGVEDSTDAFEQALATGKNVFVPKGVYNIVRTLYYAVDGQVMFGAGKDNQSVIRNLYTADRLFASSSGTGAVYKRRCGLSDLSFVGNPLTIEGVAFRGNTDDGLTGDADKSCYMQNVRISDVGAGHGLRVSSWSNNFTGVEIWGCYQGLKLGSQANACGFFGLYVTNCTKEALSIPAGNPSSVSFVNAVFQYCGGTNYMMNIQGGYNVSFDGLYIEAGTAPTAVIGVGGAAKNVSFRNVFHNLVNGTSNIPIITTNIKQCIVDGIFHAGGSMASFVQITGTLPFTQIGGMFVGAGTVTTPVDDQSTRKATVVLDGTDSRLGPLDIRALTSQNALTLRRSDTDAVVLFATGDGKLSFGADSTVPTLSRAGGTLSMTYSAGTGTFRAPQFGFGASGKPILTNYTVNPEGILSAPPGSECFTDDGKRYLKTTGTGNTGWVEK